MKRELSLFASTAPGLETIAQQEILALGVAKTRVVPGGVEVHTDRAGAMRLLVSLRTVSHLLLRVASFRSDHFERLEREIGKLDWSAWLVPGVPRKLKATSEKSKLFHTGAITERLERWIDAAMGDAGKSEGEPITIAARLVRDVVTISIDLSGEPLHRRGYRLDPGRAPLREDLAAALVIASGWDGTTPLLDPMCGSGTIAIEAAMLATKTAPRLARDFAITRTKMANPPDVERARRDARAHQVPLAAPIHASDRDPRAVERTKQNAARSGVSIDVQNAPLSSVALEGLVDRGTFVVTNPPWGERLDDAGAGLDRLHGALGALVRRLGKGASLAMLAADPRTARTVGLPLKSAFLTDAGGIKVHALVSGGSILSG